MGRTPDWPQWVIVAAMFAAAALIVWATLVNFDLGVWLAQHFNGM